MADRKVVKIQILNVEHRISNIIIVYAETFSDGSKKIRRRNVKHLKRYNDYEVYDAVVSAELLGRVYCGFLRTDARLVFLVKLTDGSVRLIQERAGSRAGLELLELT